jgi:hypothetical protein
MTSNDKWAVPLATKLIKKSGKLVTYRKVVEGSYDPITDTQLSTPMDNPIKALIQKPDIRLIDNNLIKSTSLVLMIASSDITFNIELQDTILIESIGYKVSVINPTYSGEMIAYYELVVNI